MVGNRNYLPGVWKYPARSLFNHAVFSMTGNQQFEISAQQTTLFFREHHCPLSIESMNSGLPILQETLGCVAC